MSLIAEALRKAHLDAKQQEAAHRGRAPYVAAAGHTGRRPSKAPWIVALVASNLVIAVVAVSAFRWSWREQAPAAPSAAAAETTPAVTEAERSPATHAVAAEAQVPAAPAADAAPERPSAETPPGPPPEPVQASPPAAAEAPAPTPATRPAPPPAPVPAPTPEPAAPQAARGTTGPPDEPTRFSYAMSLPDGRRVELSGVVSTSVGNQAMINDRLVRVGDRIEELKVVRIDRRGVELQGERGRVYLEIP